MALNRRQIRLELIAARKVLANPDNWIKHYSSTDKDGQLVAATDPKACRFCIMGAIMTRIPPQTEEYKQVAETLRVQIGGMWPANFNDHPDTTHQMVLAVIDAAIESVAPRNTWTKE